LLLDLVLRGIPLSIKVDILGELVLFHGHIPVRLDVPSAFT
jgi:hypothetical protein